MVEYLLLQCYSDSCRMYQVHQLNKKKTFNCKICNEKQSYQKIFGQSYQAKDLTTLVKQYNMEKSKPKPINQNNINSNNNSSNNIGNNSGNNIQQQQIKTQPRTNWNDFLDNENDSNAEDDFYGLNSNNDQDDKYVLLTTLNNKTTSINNKKRKYTKNNSNNNDNSNNSDNDLESNKRIKDNIKTKTNPYSRKFSPYVNKQKLQPQQSQQQLESEESEEELKPAIQSTSNKSAPLFNPKSLQLNKPSNSTPLFKPKSLQSNSLVSSNLKPSIPLFNPKPPPVPTSPTSNNNSNNINNINKNVYNNNNNNNPSINNNNKQSINNSNSFSYQDESSDENDSDEVDDFYGIGKSSIKSKINNDNIVLTTSDSYSIYNNEDDE